MMLEPPPLTDLKLNPKTPTTVKYCTVEDITNLFGDNVTASLETELIETAILNSTGWIHGKLRAHNIPLPYTEEIVSNTIKTIAKYYAASDCYSSLYNGDDYQSTYDMWFIKAKDLLDDYILAYWNNCADENSQLEHQVVAHRRVPSYYEKRHRR